ncbi:MAG: hypothetical protein JWQ57_3755 [Mucilaginibacter sp.]|jgi:hypothetical protein|nr:hypothetical protein [Mucilaginibacter sp.]
MGKDQIIWLIAASLLTFRTLLTFGLIYKKT